MNDICQTLDLQYNANFTSTNFLVLAFSIFLFYYEHRDLHFW
jgi:hypothetical protein